MAAAIQVKAGAIDDGKFAVVLVGLAGVAHEDGLR
jgi:hypothetical protein